jgi:hypothetical protein
MLRLLVLLLLAWLVYRGIESVLGQLRGATAPRVTVHREPHPREEITEELVACTRCGVRVPKSRTAAGEGGAVCAACAGPLR